MKRKNTSHKSQTDRTDWNRVDKLRDKDIDFSDNNDEEHNNGEEFDDI